MLMRVVEYLLITPTNARHSACMLGEYSPQALPEPASTISCLHDRFLDGPLLPTPHLYFLYLLCLLND